MISHLKNTASSLAISAGPLANAQQTLSSGQHTLQAQFSLIAENLANKDTLPTEKGGDPYRRKIAIIGTKTDPRTGAELIRLQAVAYDQRPFSKDYVPDHPLADKDGMLAKPNVNELTEMADMMDTSRRIQFLQRASAVATSMQRSEIALLK